jgi:hypothetical protein
MHFKNESLNIVRDKHQWGKNIVFTADGAQIDVEEEADFTIEDIITDKKIVFLKSI